MTGTTVSNRGFIGGLWHGAFLATAMAFANVTVVVPAFVAELTGSAVWVGGLAALIAVSSAGPQVLVARFVEPMARKRPVLLAAIYLRAFAWASLAGLVLLAGDRYPQVVLAGLVGLIGLFALGGALGGVPYTDIVGKVIPSNRRGAFFASRQAIGSLLGLAAAGVSRLVLARPYPENFATLFLLSAIALVVASLGFWVIQEPESPRTGAPPPWREYLASLKEPFLALRSMAMVNWFTGLAWLAVPFYVVAARHDFAISDEATAWFVGASVAGALLGNLAWGWIVDRHGSRQMVLACVLLSAATPLVALLASAVGWQVLVLATGMAGATAAGRSVGYPAAVLDLAPASRRSSYAGTYAFLSLPVALMPLVGGGIARASSYQTLFGVTAAGLAAAVGVVAWWWRRG